MKISGDPAHVAHKDVEPLITTLGVVALEGEITGAGEQVKTHAHCAKKTSETSSRTIVCLFI